MDKHNNSIEAAVLTFINFSNVSDLEIGLAVSGEEFDANEVLASFTCERHEVEADEFAGEGCDWSELAA